ncbi:hypothetical protein ACG2LH_15450 [Zhouia sp. PK063]|uniref:hypothetical protein n=1 Tax=Zhouia sp. PK063 TaxID=3373602 RepID=UPI0037A246D7
MKRTFVLLSAVALIASVGCKNTKNEKDTDDSMIEQNMDSTATTQDITIEKLTGSPAYADASLKLNKPSTDKVSAGDVHWDFAVKNYDLGTQTENAGENGLANSDKGQHIHFIIDDDPYSAHYEPSFDMKMDEGTHYVVAFLSRSYHEAVKNDDSFVAKKVTVGDASKGKEMNVDFSKPTLIYSRPKGTYEGDDTKNLMLDFFLLNTKLSPNGNKVRATINGKEFIITDWAPYVIKGLPKGTATVKLELLDKDNNVIPGDFNSVERTVELK